MSSKRDLKVAIVIMVVSLITGIICYASFTPPKSDNPVRIMFQNKGGKVLFTHSVHAGEYTSDCLDCHHNLEDDEVYDCSDCHDPSGDEGLLSRADAMHDQCKGCHEEAGAGPVDCNSCHSL